MLPVQPNLFFKHTAANPNNISGNVTIYLLCLKYRTDYHEILRARY